MAGINITRLRALWINRKNINTEITLVEPTNNTTGRFHKNVLNIVKC